MSGPRLTGSSPSWRRLPALWKGDAMVELDFAVEDAEPVPDAAAPMLVFRLRVTQTGPTARVHGRGLRCQIRIEPARRQYHEAEQERLRDLFGRPADWGRTLRPFLWTHATVNVPCFTDSITVDMQVPCTF